MPGPANARDSAAEQLDPRAERCDHGVGRAPSSDDQPFVLVQLVEADQVGSVGTEESPDLLRHDCEDVVRARRGCDCHRDAAECSATLREAGQLFARLGVRERDGDEVRELADPLLVVGRERLVSGDRDDNGAPERSRHRDRRRDQRGHSEHLQPCGEARGHVRVVRPAPRGTPGPPNAFERAAVDLDHRAHPGDRDARLAPLAYDHALVRGNVLEADEVRRVGAEQPRHFLGHNVEDRFRVVGLRDGDRNPAERGTALGERLERLLLHFARGDVADDRDRLVLAAADDPRFEVAQWVVVPLQRVVDDLDGVVLQRTLHRRRGLRPRRRPRGHRGRSCRRGRRSRSEASRFRSAGTRGTFRPRRPGTCCRGSPRATRWLGVRSPRASAATVRARARFARRRAPPPARAGPAAKRRARSTRRRRAWRCGPRPHEGA